MKTILNSFLFFSVISCLVVPALAQQGSSVFGYGSGPCSAYLEAYKDRGDEKTRFDSWIGGFVTGTGYHVPKLRSSLLNVRMPEAQAWIANYCRKKPQAFFVEAVEQFTFYVYNRNK